MEYLHRMGSSRIGGISVILFSTLLVLFVLLSLETLGITHMSQNGVHQAPVKIEAVKATSANVRNGCLVYFVGEVRFYRSISVQVYFLTIY